jgi:hypothetical protein
MGLSAGLVGKCVEDAERRDAEADAEQRGRRRFLLEDRQAARKQLRDFLLLAGLGF